MKICTFDLWTYSLRKSVKIVSSILKQKWFMSAHSQRVIQPFSRLSYLKVLQSIGLFSPSQYWGFFLLFHYLGETFSNLTKMSQRFTTNKLEARIINWPFAVSVSNLSPYVKLSIFYNSCSGITKYHKWKVLRMC